MKFYRRVIKTRTVLNKWLRIPLRVNILRLGSGVVTIIHVYKNKQVVTAKVDVSPRFLRPI